MTDEQGAADGQRTSRAGFFGVTGAAIAAGAWAQAARGEASVAGSAVAGRRSFVGGNFFLQLDGIDAGFLTSVEGGNVYADVIEEVRSDLFFAKKHIGSPRYEDITMQIGFATSRVVNGWIAASWEQNRERKNGAIVATNSKGEAVAAREFFDALLVETAIPTMDAASKDPAFLTLKVAPEFIRSVKASGAVGEPKKASQEQVLASSFRLEIDGLDCTKVSKIDSFTVEQTIGDEREYELPGKLEFPNLRITLPEASAQTWIQWHEDFVVKGHNDDSTEKNGRLVFLSPDRSRQIAEVKFSNLGIFKLAPEKQESDGDTIERVTAELYCERMQFSYSLVA